MSRLRNSVCAIVIAGIAVACGDSTGPAYAPATLDQALAELTIPALAAAGTSLVDVDTPAPSLSATTCPYSATTQSFVCAPITENGITIDQNFTLLSASGAKQSAFDPAGTAIVRAITSVSGDVAGQGTSLGVVGQQNITLSGLTTGPHVLDGYSSISFNGTVTDETSTYPVSIRVTSGISQLALPANQPGGAQVWPNSGAIIVDITGSFGPVSLNQRTTIIFRGTSTALVTVTDPGGGSKNCTVDLAVAQPVCP